MGSIQSSIELQDKFTGVMTQIIRTVNLSIDRMEQMQAVMNAPVSSSPLSGVRDQIDEVAVAAQKLDTVIQGIGMQSQINPIEMQTPQIPQIPFPEVEEKITGITDKLNEVAMMQDAIQDIGKKIYLLPKDTRKEIIGISQEIERMQQAIEFLKENPLQMDASIAELQVSAISNSLDDIIARQGQMDTLMGNAPSQMVELSAKPVEILVHWESYKGVDVFTNTGIERFEQEVTSVNSMMERLSEIQSRITQQANESEILSPQASYDIQSVENRVQELTSMINQAEDNSLNIGTEEANTQLERLRMQLNQTLQLQNDLDTAMQDMDISEINTAYLRLSQNVADTERLVRDSFSNISPVEIPVHWETDTMPVFTNTGVDRFRQEVQNANEMMEQLSSTQDTIARQTYNTNLFPPESFQNLNSLAVRIDSIRTRIQQIENQPVNIGTDMANAGLEQLRGQLNQALQEQQNLNHAMESMDVSAANEAYLRLSQTVGNTERYIRDNVDEQGRFNRVIEDGTEKANGLISAIKGAVAAYATIQSITAAISLSDQMVSTTARLDMMNDGLQTTEDLQNMIFLSAERTRGSYQATADAVSKLGLMAGDAFSSSEEIIAFMEQINKQFTIAGTDATGIESAMLQLTQAMGSGVLRGEEYNSILEQAPNIVQNISRYIEENESVLAGVAGAMKMDVEDLAGNVQGNMKDIASEGILSAELIKNAMFYAAEETNEKFENMPMTFSQIWTSFQNNAQKAFQPVLERINEIANSEAFQGFVNDAVESLSVVAGITLEIFDFLESAAGMVADNWSWLSPIIYGVAGALAVYYGAQLAANTVTGISTAITAAKAFAEQVHAASLAMETGATFAATAAQYGFNAALLACPITWIIILIIALIALFYAAVAAVNKFAGTSVSATGIICGVFMTALAFVGNVFTAAINFIIDLFVTLWNFIASFVNFLANVFTDPIGAIARLFFDLVDTVLSLLQSVASAIDWIFGSNLAEGLQGWRDSIGDWVEETYGNGVEIMGKVDADDLKLGRFEYKDAWNVGYEFGKGIDESIANFDLASLFETEVPSPEDYKNLGNYGEDLVYGMDDIAGNTAAIKDSMDITEEDLRYLRDIAEQESINKYTVAEVHVDMSGMQNSINSGDDIDGFITKLTDSVKESVDTIAEGVHE